MAKRLSDSEKNNYSTAFFTLGVLTQMPVIGDYVEIILTAIEQATDEKCGISGIKKVYDNSVTANKKKVTDAIAANTVKLNTFSSAVLTADQEAALEPLKSKPKQYCQKVVEKYKGPMKELKEFQEKKAQMRTMINKIKTQNKTYNDVKGDATGFGAFFGGYKLEKLLLLELKKRNYTVDSSNWTMILGDLDANLTNEISATDFVATQKIVVGDNMPDCNTLPADTTTMPNKTTFLEKAVAGYDTIKHYFKECLKDLALDIAAVAIGFAIEKVFEILADVLGLFAIKALKIGWYLIKLIYFSIRAAAKTEAWEIAEYFGKAVGAGFRIILILLNVGRRRIMKRYTRKNAKKSKKH